MSYISLSDLSKICKHFNLDTGEVFDLLASPPLAAAPPALNNETTGMTAEKALCLAFNIADEIEDTRVDTQLCDQLLQSGILGDICQRNAILPHTHIGKENGKTDFLGTSKGKDITISLKTLKKSDGKICPQGGQPTYVSFHEKWHPECPKPNKELSRLEANTQRWTWIKENIGDFLNKMQKQLFCCDVLILIRDCDKAPKAELMENKHYDFAKLNIGFKRPVYAEPPHKKKKDELAEFSTGVFHILPDGTEVDIGEFQFHFKSRKVVKFRFKNTFYY
jgi:hypothetical protein